MTKRQGLLLALVLASGSTLLTYLWYTGRNPAPAEARTPASQSAPAGQAGQSVTIQPEIGPATAAGYQVPRHERAVAIMVDTVRGAGGLVQASDRVDIMMAAIDPKEHRLTETIIQDVPVLGPSGAAAQGGADKRQIVVSVSPHDAQRLMAAQIKGALLISLRNPTDREYAYVRPVVNPTPRKAAPVQAAPAAPAPPPVAIQVAAAPAPRRSVRRAARPASMGDWNVPPEPIPGLSLLSAPPAQPQPEVRQVPLPPAPAAPPGKAIEVVKGTTVQTVTVKE